MLRKLIRALLFLVVLLAAVWLVARWSTVHGDAFMYVAERVRASAEIRKQIGTVKDVKLAKLAHRRISYSVFGDERRASLPIVVIGSDGDLDLFVKARRETASWKIVSAAAEGGEIDLER